MQNIRLGILTFHKAKNYGSVLQAFALQTYTKSLGMNVEVIDYVPPKQEQVYSIFRKNNSLKNIILNIATLFDYRYIKRKHMLFENFFEQYELSKSINKCNELLELNYDIVCVGSDQIWNMGIDDFDLIYFLPFYHKKKISYAVSMGIVKKNGNEYLSNDIKNYLDEFCCLSVRENKAADMLKEVLETPVQVVLDPTFLVEENEWNKLVGEIPLIKEDYILFYSIEYYDDLIETAKRISLKYKLPVYVVYTCRKTYKAMIKGFKRTRACAPFDFLNYIKNAKYVISSSFHGCVFSIILKKQFFAIERYVNNEVIYEDRLRALLEGFGIENRFVNVMTEFEKIDYEDINYESIEKNIKEKIVVSKQYLAEALTIDM